MTMITTGIVVAAALGFLISAYGYYVEQKLKKDTQYKPTCDLSDTISCSKPLLSSYGKLLGIQNALVGIIYYPTIIIFVFLYIPIVLFALTAIAGIVSLYLAWILFFKIRTLCMLCLAIYLINLVLFILSLLLIADRFHRIY